MSAWGFVRRRPLVSLLLILLVALGAWIWHERQALRAFPGIISAYTAKEYCSCRYVMNNPADYCLGYVKQSVSISDFQDDPQQHRVTARGLGRSSSAVWLGPREGCRLEP